MSFGVDQVNYASLCACKNNFFSDFVVSEILTSTFVLVFSQPPLFYVPFPRHLNVIVTSQWGSFS